MERKRCIVDLGHFILNTNIQEKDWKNIKEKFFIRRMETRM